MKKIKKVVSWYRENGYIIATYSDGKVRKIKE